MPFQRKDLAAQGVASFLRQIKSHMDRGFQECGQTQAGTTLTCEARFRGAMLVALVVWVCAVEDCDLPLLPLLLGLGVAWGRRIVWRRSSWRLLIAES
jgi:hypothetical protein